MSIEEKVKYWLIQSFLSLSGASIFFYLTNKIEFSNPLLIFFPSLFFILLFVYMLYKSPMNSPILFLKAKENLSKKDFVYFEMDVKKFEISITKGSKDNLEFQEYTNLIIQGMSPEEKKTFQKAKDKKNKFSNLYLIRNVGTMIIIFCWLLNIILVTIIHYKLPNIILKLRDIVLVPFFILFIFCSILTLFIFLRFSKKLDQIIQNPDLSYEEIRKNDKVL